MRYISTAVTDQGTTRSSNQDSIVLKHVETPAGEIVMALVCDGMGGLAKGELASASAVREFSVWFSDVLLPHCEELSASKIAEIWKEKLNILNERIAEYSQDHGLKMGTTFTGLLMINDEVLIVHIGDSRVYHNDEELRLMTTDHTFVEREVQLGHLTPEQAKTDRRRNMLLQCLGGSHQLDPQIIIEPVQPGFYLLCSDGFRHEIADHEMHAALNPGELVTRDLMKKRILEMIEVVKNRNERDNISVVLIQVV